MASVIFFPICCKEKYFWSAKLIILYSGQTQIEYEHFFTKFQLKRSYFQERLKVFNTTTFRKFVWQWKWLKETYLSGEWAEKQLNLFYIWLQMQLSKYIYYIMKLLPESWARHIEILHLYFLTEFKNFMPNIVFEIWPILLRKEMIPLTLKEYRRKKCEHFERSSTCGNSQETPKYFVGVGN